MLSWGFDNEYSAMLFTVKDSDFVETEVIAVEATLLVKHPKDEVCPDEKYAITENVKPNPTTTPLSTSYRLGGVDYYSLTYDYPSTAELTSFFS